MNIQQVDYNGLIPNNVDLGSDVRVKRALEKWHPGYLNWWKDMGRKASRSRWSIYALPSALLQRLGQIRLLADAGISLGHTVSAGGRGPYNSVWRT